VDCTINNKTLVSQHKNSLYYSETEGEIVEEGMAKICHQKMKLGLSTDKFIE